MANRKPYKIPDGWTMEMLEEAAADYARKKRNEYNRAHRDLIEQQRIRSSANLLRKNGYYVMPIDAMPAGEPFDWQEEEVKMVIGSIHGYIEEYKGGAANE